MTSRSPAIRRTPMQTVARHSLRWVAEDREITFQPGRGATPTDSRLAPFRSTAQLDGDKKGVCRWIRP